MPSALATLKPYDNGNGTTVVQNDSIVYALCMRRGTIPGHVLCVYSAVYTCLGVCKLTNPPLGQLNTHTLEFAECDRNKYAFLVQSTH